MASIIRGLLAEVRPPHGPVLVSADVHGNWEDFARLRELFLASDARGEDPVWISTGDWVHGPNDAEPAGVTGDDGAPLYDYPDRTPELLEALFALMDAHPGRVISILGNHEHAHLGGPRTRKFHDDEAAHLEARIAPAARAELARRFRTWPLVVRVPAVRLVVTHGALRGAESAAQLESLTLDATGEPARTILKSAMTSYGYVGDGDVRLLEALELPGGLLVHGHDRDEEGWAPSGQVARLLCTSFGARRDRKAYLWLDPAHPPAGPDDVGASLRRLYP